MECVTARLGKQDGQPSSEDVGDELIVVFGIEERSPLHNQDVKELKREQHDLK